MGIAHFWLGGDIERDLLPGRLFQVLLLIEELMSKRRFGGFPKLFCVLYRCDCAQPSLFPASSSPVQCQAF